jgi:prolipoprotein diacylglyceryltransferase
MNILLQAISTFLTEGIKKHGTVFAVLIGIIIYFQTENQKLEKKFDICNSQILMIYKDQNMQVLQALERNTQALEKIAGK